MRTTDLVKWMRDRHNIYEKRQQGFKAPWSQDPIFQNNRFCNVYRELDTQTKWFADNWRKPRGRHQDVWFASLVFRRVNWHETAAEIGFPIPWYPKRFKYVLNDRQKKGLRTFNPAYMITTAGAPQDKASFFAETLTEVWKDRKRLRWREGDTLQSFHERLITCQALGSFMSGQVIADVKYIGPWRRAIDWWSFAASGPGSRRGLNRVLDRPVAAPWKEHEWKAALEELHLAVRPHLKKMNMPRIHAQDLQNCLCEFDKYERIRLGEGRSKQRYQGGAE